MNNDIIAIYITHIQNYFECTNCLYDDDDIMDIIITSEHEKNRKCIYNVENYVEHIVPSFSSESFKLHFRYLYNNNINNRFYYN